MKLIDITLAPRASGTPHPQSSSSGILAFTILDLKQVFTYVIFFFQTFLFNFLKLHWTIIELLYY